MKRNLISLSAMALLLSGPAFSAAPAMATTSTSVSAAVAALNFSSNCAGGGTRVSTGTWDATSGALSLSSTDTACVGANGESHDGARTLNGTMLLNGASSYTVDITVQESFTVTRDGVTKLQHTCTFARKGSFDSTTDIFTGAVSHNNCVDTGEVWDHQHGIESLLRDSNVIDVPQPPSGVTPPQKPSGTNMPHLPSGVTPPQKPSGANMPHLPSDATPPTINADGAITIKLPSGVTPPPDSTVNSDGTVTFTPSQKPSGANKPQLPSDATPPTINADGTITIKLPSGVTPPLGSTVNSDGTVTFTPSQRPSQPAGATTTTSGA